MHTVGIVDDSLKVEKGEKVAKEEEFGKKGEESDSLLSETRYGQF